MSIIRVGREVFPVLLKGTAWIDKENLQIIHLETDLVEPIPKAKLYLEHQALDYGPVQFEKNGTRMWLPLNQVYLTDFSCKLTWAQSCGTLKTNSPRRVLRSSPWAHHFPHKKSFGLGPEVVLRRFCGF
jgi:hypothetical protein